MTYQAMLAAMEAGAIQGFTAAAPFWAQSVTSGKAVDWINVKEELPAKFVPTMSSALGTRGEVIRKDPELVRKMAAVVADLGVAVKERPADVRAAMAKLFDGLDPKTLALLYEGESRSWQTKPLTAEQVQREIDYLKSSALAPPELDKVPPLAMIYRP
jgi:ABC-type nitrate/sulfonate/bicarbonate transport system substrate-binding protein